MESLLRSDRPLDSFSSDSESPSLGASSRRPDIDYWDVFGGPPRSSSDAYELQRNLGECVGGCHGDEVRGGRRGWPSFGEKPAFGDELVGSPSQRRKDLGDDFFGDIFRGSDSSCSTPRRQDMMPSTSSSRILSPIRSLPPRIEGLSGSSSLPSPLSLSKKMAKELENPLSVLSPENSMEKSEGSDRDAGMYFPSVVHHIEEMQDYFETDSYSSFHQSSLSSQLPHDQDLSSKAIQAARIGIRKLSKEESNDSNVSTVGHFHFSIYKWARNGVMLVMPSIPKEKSKDESQLSGLPVPFLQGLDSPNRNRIVPSALPSEVENQHSSLLGECGTPKKSTAASVKDMGNSLPRKFQFIPLPTAVIPESGQVTKDPQPVCDSIYGPDMSSGMEVPAFQQESQNPIAWKHKDTLNFRYGSDEKDNNRKEEEKQDLVGSTTTKKTGDGLVDVRKQSNKKPSVDQSFAQDIPEPLVEKMPNGRARGTVKEVIKIFDPELSCNPLGVTKSRSQGSKVMDFEKFKVQEHVKFHASKTTEEKSYMINSSSEQPEASSLTVGKILKDKKLYFDAVKSNESAHAKEQTSRPHFEVTHESSKSSPEIAEEPNYEVEEFQVEYVIEEKSELPWENSNTKDIQSLDAKIRTWSTGKEGNIRSMLSTLQYVLWSGSGWKPVPLVDIIESNSVKRAYQKALLCLHPDKLQQRDAPMHEKYIAEKVFRILQEAWDHFQTSSGF